MHDFKLCLSYDPLKDAKIYSYLFYLLVLTYDSELPGVEPRHPSVSKGEIT